MPTPNPPTSTQPTPGWSDSVLGNHAMRPSVMQLNIKDLPSLYNVYIPVFTDGGIFLQTSRSYALGDELYVLLTLPNDPQRHAIAGLVAWVTPPGQPAGRVQGVGIRFPSDQRAAAVKVKIETLLGDLLTSGRPTHTI